MTYRHAADLEFPMRTMSPIRTYRITLVASLLAILLFVFDRATHLDLFAHMVHWLESWETTGYEPDEYVLPGLLILVGLAVDLMTTRQRQLHSIAVQAQRLHTLQVTMRTVQDIVNNSLNEIQLVRLSAEGRLDQEHLDLMDRVVVETTSKLKQLGELEGTPERMSAAGWMIDYEGERSGR